MNNILCHNGHDEDPVESFPLVLGAVNQWILQMRNPVIAGKSNGCGSLCSVQPQGSETELTRTYKRVKLGSNHHKK